MKIDKKILEEIRENIMREEAYKGMSIEQVAFYNTIDTSDDLYFALCDNPNIDKDELGEVALDNLYRAETEYTVVHEEYEEEFILIRNNNKLPLGLSIEQLNMLDLGYHVWIEYGDLNPQSKNYPTTFYTIDCIEGVNELFELPHFKRLFNILEKYLKERNLLENGLINTDETGAIFDFNKWVMSNHDESVDFLKYLNSLL